ncbi:RNA-binding domain-containing protein [Rhizodiscina lignyota]|uniref:RNA-binding domain-containing protein n=1 Tax=Rhizodiscina lignyota TaxID=1504668 RepID=A0A9P4MEK5_9PEZI|nr:RNA-binding domain-containing protein [Rhizodiscina lignyota]
MNKIRQIEKLNQTELDNVTPPNASWHTDYRDTAYIYIGGLPYNLSEGDIVVVFSQYGEPVWLKLARDKESGKSKGFAWLKYEDQRSCDLAVDNLNGAMVLGRKISVDHARYKVRDDEDMNMYMVPKAGEESDEEGRVKKRIGRKEMDLTPVMTDDESENRERRRERRRSSLN